MHNYNIIRYLVCTVRILSENKHKYFAIYSQILFLQTTIFTYFVNITSDSNMFKKIFCFAYEFIHMLNKYFFAFISFEYICFELFWNIPHICILLCDISCIWYQNMIFWYHMHDTKNHNLKDMMDFEIYKYIYLYQLFR